MTVKSLPWLWLHYASRLNSGVGRPSPARVESEHGPDYTAVVKQDGGWWVGWIEEVPGVNAQERTKSGLLESLRTVVSEALESNRAETISAAGESYSEGRVAV